MNRFENILLLGRPAAGKSEFIDCLKRVDENERTRIFHIGKFSQIDDFVWIWEKFLEDNMWEESGFERIYSHKEGDNYGLNEDAGRLFDLMLARFNKEVKNISEENPNYYENQTLFIEFSRGGENAYAKAFKRLSKEILEKAAILYIKVSYEESWRRNIARYEEKKKHSILAHMATKRVMEAFYRTDDWDALSKSRSSGYIDAGGVKVPFMTVLNEPEIKDPILLSKRYEDAMGSLHELFRNRRS